MRLASPAEGFTLDSFGIEPFKTPRKRCLKCLPLYHLSPALKQVQGTELTVIEYKARLVVTQAMIKAAQTTAKSSG